MVEEKNEYNISQGEAINDDFYKVERMPQSNANEIEYDPLLPRHPFFTLAVGPRHTGKSNCMVDLVVNKIGPAFFDLIIIYCKTIHDDDKWDLLTKKWVHQDFIHTVYDENILREEYDTICKVRETKYPEYRTLIIFDDMIADNVSNKTHVDMLGQLAAMGRHKGISVLFATQYYKALAPLLRTNATHLLVFFQANGDEFDKIQKGNCAHMSKGTFLKIYNQVFEGSDPHQEGGEKPFLQVNNTKILGERYWKNWNIPIRVEGIGLPTIEEEDESSDNDEDPPN